MNVLVDTSVWVDHFRRSNAALVQLILADAALTHPMVILELACGTPPTPRARTLGDIAELAFTRQTTHAEVMRFSEQERLYGQGCGLVDMMLLTATMITPGARLWTLDLRLSELAARFDVAYVPAIPVS